MTSETSPPETSGAEPLCVRRADDIGVTNGSVVRIDPHVKVLDEHVVARAKRRGLDAIVYAPHFTPLPAIRETAKQFSEEEFNVLPGREIFTGTWRNRKHVLALDLQAPIPDFVSLEAAFEEFTRQEATVLIPHPEFLTVSLDRSDINRWHDAIHGVETYNPKHWQSHNRTAESIATETRLPPFGSSYAHLPGTVGEVWTTFTETEPTEESIIQTLQDGGPRRVHHRNGVGHQLRRALEFGHLFYENSITKFDRVVVSGQEPTHPEQPIYEGRFSIDRQG